MKKRDFIKSAGIIGTFLIFGSAKAKESSTKMSKIYKGKFGSCCKDLTEAMSTPPNSFFFVSENKVLFQTVGYVQTEQGPGWFDQAVIFCPFCGKQLQSKEEIATKSKNE